MPVDVVANIPPQSDVLLDANIFIYGFNNVSAQCRTLLERCAREEVFGVTTVEVINEVTHRLMLADALNTGVITRESADQLRRRLPAIRGLRRYWRQASSILEMNVLILELEERRRRRAAILRQTHGLFTNDSVILAALDEFGLDSLASADSDFDHVPAITVFKPTDLP